MTSNDDIQNRMLLENKSLLLIIPFYNGLKYTNRLIESIVSTNIGIPFKILFVDNSELNHRINGRFGENQNIIVIETDPRVGYGRACNLGFQYAIDMNFSHAMIVNQDGYFHFGAINSMMNCINFNERSIVTPIIVEYDSNKIEPFYIEHYFKLVPELISDLLFRKKLENYNIPQLNGACFLYDVNELKEFSFLFDEIFHMYFEDEDLYIRLKNKGFQIILNPKSFFHHHHSNTNESLHNFQFILNKKISEGIYFLKNHSGKLRHKLVKLILKSLRNMVFELLTFRYKNLLIEAAMLYNIMLKISKIEKNNS